MWEFCLSKAGIEATIKMGEKQRNGDKLKLVPLGPSVMTSIGDRASRRLENTRQAGRAVAWVIALVDGWRLHRRCSGLGGPGAALSGARLLRELGFPYRHLAGVVWVLARV